MHQKPVEWVLVVYYGPEAHRATYGRHVRSDRYTKDYIQLSKKEEFLSTMRRLFSLGQTDDTSVELTYQWPLGTAPGAFVVKSSDRPHLKWVTSEGAPQAWKMTPQPSDATAETIPGNPTHTEFDDAEAELKELATKGVGQPHLIAVKLRDEPRTLHLRVYLQNPAQKYAWASLDKLPSKIQALARKTRRTRAIASSAYESDGVAPSPKVLALLPKLANPRRAASIDSTLSNLSMDEARELADYLHRPGHGLFFDSRCNHDAWFEVQSLPAPIASITDRLLRVLAKRLSTKPQSDAAAETADSDPDEEQFFQSQINNGNYTVDDTTATAKTRGSAQRVFSRAVKKNYGWKCALTGISTREFLVASHIVPWSVDKSIRLDPSNGICLSLLVDRAFEAGFLIIEDDLTVVVNSAKTGVDVKLSNVLATYDGQKLTAPKKHAPKQAYLRRRRNLVGV